jgi:hypothetical protein
MKTTIDLHDELVRAFKLHAARRSLKLNATAVAILRSQLGAKKNRAEKSLPKTLPLMPARPLPTPRVKPMSAQAMSDYIKQADLDAEKEGYEKASGH